MFSNDVDAEDESGRPPRINDSHVKSKSINERNKKSLKGAGKILKILHLEDSKSDAKLIGGILKRSKLEFETLVVDNKIKFKKALRIYSPDIILADHSLPSFNSHEALEIIHKLKLKIPFILITAAMSDEFAVDAIKRGADDYILKDRLNRLPIAIHNALKKFQREEERQIYLDELVENEKRYHALVENANDAIVIFNIDGRPVYASQSIYRVLGYTESETMLLRINEILHPNDKEELANKMLECLNNPGVPIVGFIGRIKHKHDGWRWIEATLTNMLHDSAVKGIINNFRDVTERKQAEYELQKSESNLQAIFENTSEGFILIDTKGIVQSFNNKSKNIILLNVGKVIRIGDSIFEFIENSRKGNYESDISKILTGITLQYDYPFKRKNDEIKWFNFTISPVYQHGGIKGLCITCADITERKIAEEMLLSSQSNLHAIIENTDDCIYSIDHNFRYLTFNELFQNKVKRMCGLDINPGDNIFRFLEKAYPTELGEWEKIYSRAFEGESLKFEKKFSGKDLCIYDCFSVYPIRKNDKVIGVSCFVVDITKQKITESAHQQAELRYRQIVETAQEGIWLTNKMNITTFVNQKMCDILGYSEEEMLGKENTHFMDHAGKKAAYLSLERRKTGIAENFDMGFITKNGKSIWTNISGNPILDDKGQYNGTLGMVTDITEKKNLENLLNKANELARIGTWEVDLLNNTLYWSEITKQIHEVSDDFIPDLTTALEFYKPTGSRQAISQAVNEAVEKGGSFDLELQLFTAKGNEPWVRAIGEAECIEGKCIRLFGSFQDINSSKTAELEVLKLYEEKNIILESIGDAFFAVDQFWRVNYWNHQAEKLLDTPKQEILGKNLWEIFSNSIDSLSYLKYHEAIKTSQVIHFEDHYVPLEKWYWISAYPSKNGLSVFFKDITEQKKSDEERLKMTADIIQRNKTLEQFSYIVSHNLRAPVANVIGLCHALIKDEVEKDLKAELMGGLYTSVNKLDEIIKDLNSILNLRLGLDENRKMVSFTELVSDIKLSIESTISNERAIIVYDFSEEDKLLAIKSYVYSIFYNLIINSLKYRQPGLSPVIKIKSYLQNGRIILLFSDNGLGIDMQKRGDQVFGLYKRFHANGAEGKGIGLYMVKAQTEAMGGEVSVTSEVNKGTEFKIELPIKLDQE